MAILQVRDVDDILYEALKNRAKLKRRSISQEVINIIENYLSKPSIANQDQTDAFLNLSGAWEGEESAEEIIDKIRSSRKKSKRFG